MPRFKLNENRLIDTDDVAGIQYTPANSMTVADPKPFQRTPSYLNIKLKSRSEEIRLDGEEADAVWAAFQKASQKPGNPPTQRQKTKSLNKGKRLPKR